MYEIKRIEKKSRQTGKPYRLLAAALSAALLSLLPAQQAWARCTATMDSINFGNVDFLVPNTPQVQTSVTVTCTKQSNIDRVQKFNVCLAADGGQGGQEIKTQVDPRHLCLNGSCTANNPPLEYNFYIDANYATVWGATNKSRGSNINKVISIPAGSVSKTETFPIYAKIDPSQANVTRGHYTADFSGTSTAITNIATNSDTARACSNADFRRYSERFPFTVSATVINNCHISAPQDINFGNVNPAATNLQGQTYFDVTCTKDIPYNIGLQPSNGNDAGQGEMRAVQAGNTDTVLYTLRSRPGMNGLDWGNLISKGSVGNDVSGRGTGLPQRHNIYATVNSVAGSRPGEYRDKVIINVHY